jgi:hypothetical protein
MRAFPVVLAVVALAVPASAERAHLLDASTKLSLLPDAVRAASLAQGPVPDARTNLFLLGLGLTVGGLVLGAAGFAVLYFCREGTDCYSQTTQIVGWVLAVPGLIPLAVGLFMLYAASDGGRGVPGNVHGAHPVTSRASSPGRWVLTGGPIPGGLTIGAATTF